MNSETLAFDLGQNIVGIYCIEDSTYTPYMGKEKIIGAKRLIEAKEIISYNGNHYDITELKKILGIDEKDNIKFKGDHVDMREICWSNRIWGRDLHSTYDMHFNERASYPDTYEGDNYQDTYETFKLWQCWKLGTLKVMDGNIQ